MLFLLCMFMAFNSIYAMDEGKKEASTYKQRVVKCSGFDFYSCVKLFSLQGGRRCAAHYRDGVSVWDVEDGQSTCNPSVRITHRPSATHCALSADERSCATICTEVDDGFMTLWDIERATSLLQVKRPVGFQNMVHGLAMTGNLIVFSDCHRLHVTDIRSGTYGKVINLEDVVRSLACPRHLGNVVLAFMNSGTNEVNLQEGSIVSSLETGWATGGSVYVSDDGKRIVTKKKWAPRYFVSLYKDKALAYSYQPEDKFDRAEQKSVIDDVALSGDGSVAIVTESEKPDPHLRGWAEQRVRGYLHIIGTEEPYARRTFGFDKIYKAQFPVVANYDASRIVATKNDGQMIVLDKNRGDS